MIFLFHFWCCTLTFGIRMERAEFVVQVFFDNIELFEKVSSEFTILIRFFELSMIEIDKLSGEPGVLEVQSGKRLTLKMPPVEALDVCPMYIFIRTPRPGSTTARKYHHKIHLQNAFNQAIQNPGRYVQQQFTESIRGSGSTTFATVQFAVSICYTSSTQEALTNLEPIMIRPQSSMESEVSIKSSSAKRKDMSTNTRTPLAPDPPETRTRSIFYFDRQELMEENTLLVEEINRLSDLVQRLREIVESHDQEKPTTKKKRAPPPQATTKPLRSEYIYNPPSLRRNANKRAVTGKY